MRSCCSRCISARTLLRSLEPLENMPPQNTSRPVMPWAGFQALPTIRGARRLSPPGSRETQYRSLYGRCRHQQAHSGLHRTLEQYSPKNRQRCGSGAEQAPLKPPGRRSTGATGPSGLEPAGRPPPPGAGFRHDTDVAGHRPRCSRCAGCGRPGACTLPCRGDDAVRCRPATLVVGTGGAPCSCMRSASRSMLRPLVSSWMRQALVDLGGHGETVWLRRVMTQRTDSGISLASSARVDTAHRRSG